MNGKKVLKVSLISTGIFIGTLLVVLLLVPVFTNMENIRTKAVDVVNSKINGELSLDSISLSLITGPKLNIKGIDLKDSKGESIFKLKKAALKIPLISLVKQTPDLTLEILEPDILIKQENSQLNVLTLIRTDDSKPKKEEIKKDTDKTKDSTKEGSSFVEKMITNSHVSVLVKKANFSFIKDSKQLVKATDLSFTMKDLSLKPNEKSSIKIELNLDLNLDKKMYFKGPLLIQIDLTPNDKIYDIAVNVDLSKFEYNIQDILNKTTSDQSNFNLATVIDLNKSDVNISSLKVKIPSLELTASGTIKELTAKTPKINLKNSINLTKDKQDLRIDNTISIATGYNLKSSIKSSYLNIGAFLPKKSSTTGSTTVTNSKEKGKGTPNKKKGSSSDLEKLLKDLAANKTLQKINLHVDMDLKKIDYDKIQISSLKNTTDFKNMDLSTSVSLLIAGGKINSDITTRLKDKTPYNFTAKISNVDLKKTLTQLLPTYQNLLSGMFDTQISAQGNLQAHDIVKDAKVSGKFTVNKPVISLIDMSKILDDMLSTISEKVKEKLSYDLSKNDQFKSLKAKVLKQKLTTDLATASFSLQDKIAKVQNLYLKSTPNNGLDLRGDATINLNNQDLDSKFIIEDVYNLTKVKDINLDQKGIKIEKVFVEGDVFKVPFSIKCKLTAPCYKYEESSNYLTSIAEDKAEKALKKKGEELIKKQTDGIQKNLKKQLKSILKR